MLKLHTNSSSPETLVHHPIQRSEIMTKDFHLQVYKIHLTQELKSSKYGKSREYVVWAM